MGRSKYGAVKTTVDGVTFHSKGEAGRYEQLKLLLRAGQIEDLTLQVRYPLTVHGKLIATYVADFNYWEKGIEVVEDFKGCRTPEYRLKAKLFEILYGKKILETGSKPARRHPRSKET